MSRPTPLDVPLLRRLYIEEQKTIAEMAAFFQINYETMRRRLLRAGIQPRSKKEAHIISSRRRGKPGKLEADWLTKEYVEKGRTTVDIARDLGVDSNTVLYHMRKAGIALRSRSERMKKVWSDEQFREGMVGENSWAWKGGRSRNQGYMQVYAPDHPDSDVRGRIFEHRLVMESKIGRRLRPEERVHHKNHVKTDNRPENLELLAGDSEHAELHGLERRLHRLAGFASLHIFVAWLQGSYTWRLA